MVRTTLEDQAISELSERSQVMMMSRWQEGNEEIIFYPMVSWFTTKGREMEP